MSYTYRASGSIRIEPAPEWADLKRSGFLDHGDGRDIRIVAKVDEADDGRKTVLAAEVVCDQGEPRCYDIDADLRAMVERFPGRTWAGHIEAVGEDGDDRFRLYVEQGRAVVVRPTLMWPARESEDAS